MKPLLVRDLMQTSVLSVSPAARLLDIHQLFVAEEIHGAPVIDEDDRSLRGMVSNLDLLRAALEQLELEEPRSRCAADIMVPSVVTIGPDATIAEAAQLMRDQRIHRLVVVEDREVVGILSTFDVIDALIEHPPARIAPASLSRASGDPVC